MLIPEQQVYQIIHCEVPELVKTSHLMFFFGDNKGPQSFLNFTGKTTLQQNKLQLQMKIAISGCYIVPIIDGNRGAGLIVAILTRCR